MWSQLIIYSLTVFLRIRISRLTFFTGNTSKNKWIVGTAPRNFAKTRQVRGAWKSKIKDIKVTAYWFFKSFEKSFQIFHSRSINNKINRSHERVLRIVYHDCQSSFKNLLEKDGTVSIHLKSLQKLATEMFRVSKNFSVPLMSELFYQIVNHCDLRNPY